jgi:hypothetical protein
MAGSQQQPNPCQTSIRPLFGPESTVFRLSRLHFIGLIDMWRA